MYAVGLESDSRSYLIGTTIENPLSHLPGQRLRVYVFAAVEPLKSKG